MKYPAVLSTLALAVFATSAGAQTITVRSGEHDGFSRLVLPVDLDTPWSLGRDRGAYILHLRDRPVIDTADIFRRIARSRIADAIAPAAGTLQIDLGCDCHANAFVMAPGLLVIDVIDGPPSPISPFERAPDPVSRPIVAADEGDIADYWRQAGQNERRAVEEITRRVISVDRAREDLIGQLARAVSQGLVEAEVGPPVPYARDNGSLLFAETAIDRELGLTSRDRRGASLSTCPLETSLAIATWGDTTPFASQLSEARKKMVGEFDHPDVVAVTRLARLYLYFGMGPEAANVLAAFPDIAQDPNILFALAAIIDDPEAAENDPMARRLAGRANCGDEAAIWAFLVDPVTGFITESTRGGIVRTFSGWPAALRQQLGPELVRRLMAVGATEAARRIDAAVTRLGTGETSAEILIAARIDSPAVGYPTARLVDLAEAQRPESPVALLALVDQLFKLNQPVDPALTEAAAALAFEFRDTEWEKGLSRAHILGLASASAFEVALNAFDRLPESLATESLHAELLERLAEDGTDEFFLVRALSLAGATRDVLPIKTATALASRLLELGFAEEARAILGKHAAETAPVFLARASLRAGDPRDALRQLAGRDEPQAQAVKARAFTGLGDFTMAEAAWDAAGSSDEALKAAWRAGSWERVIAEGAPEERAILDILMPERTEQAELESTVSQASGPANETGDNTAAGSLAHNHALIAQSGEVREAVAALLERHKVPLP